MKALEMKDQFDLLYNNLSSNAAPGLDEYEISLLLTKAQDEIVKNYINPAGNKYQAGVNNNSKRQIDLSKIIKTKSHSYVTITASTLSETGICCTVPYDKDILTILNEKIYLYDNNKKIERTLIPIHHTEYLRLSSTPYGEPMKRQVWKILDNGVGSNIDLVFNTEDYNILLTNNKYDYNYSYIRLPYPIILTNLNDYYYHSTVTSIRGKTEPYSTENVCELNEEIQEEIIQRAVELAKAGYQTDANDLQTQMTLGQRSE